MHLRDLTGILKVLRMVNCMWAVRVWVGRTEAEILGEHSGATPSSLSSLKIRFSQIANCFRRVRFLASIWKERKTGHLLSLLLSLLLPTNSSICCGTSYIMKMTPLPDFSSPPIRPMQSDRSPQSKIRFTFYAKSTHTTHLQSTQRITYHHSLMLQITSSSFSVAFPSYSSILICSQYAKP